MSTGQRKDDAKLAEIGRRVVEIAIARRDLGLLRERVDNRVFRNLATSAEVAGLLGSNDRVEDLDDELAALVQAYVLKHEART